MTEQQKEQFKIKDLLIKLQVLVNGILEERKKSQGYLKRIKEYEDSVQKKESEIVELTKEKFELKSKLTLEKSKQGPVGKKGQSTFSTFFQKMVDKPPDDSKIAELEATLNQKEYEIKDLSQRIMEQKENFDQQKIKFQTMITLQNQQIMELKKSLEEEKKKEVKPVIVQKDDHEKIEALNRKFNIERDEFERKLSELRSTLSQEKEKNESLEEKLEQYKEAYESKKMENIAMKRQVTDLDSKLAQTKKDLYNKQLAPRTFQVERIKEGVIKQKKVMTITFQWNKNKNITEVIFKRMKSGGKLKEEVVNILDIQEFKHNEKKKDIIDIVFTVSFFKYNIYFIFIV